MVLFNLIADLTKSFSALNVVTADLSHGLDRDWHVAPNRQIVIVLKGVLAIEGPAATGIG